MKLYELILADEGWSYVDSICEAFGGNIALDESNWMSVLYEVDGNTYAIPEEEDAEDFKRAVEESLRTGKNMVLERYKQFPSEPYDPDSDY